MSPLELTDSDVGEAIRIETKVKSRPIRGTILELNAKTDHVVVTLQQGFGSKTHLLTADNEVSIER